MHKVEIEHIIIQNPVSRTILYSLGIKIMEREKAVYGGCYCGVLMLLLLVRSPFFPHGNVQHPADFARQGIGGEGFLEESPARF